MLTTLSYIFCCKCCNNRNQHIFNNGEKKNLAKKITIKRKINEGIEESFLTEDTAENKNDEIKIDIDHCILKRNCDPNKYYQWDEIEDEIGRGSFGVVYKVRGILFQQIRAMKKISKSGLDSKKNSLDFVNEIRILRNLDHPNIIKIYELFEDENFFYIVTDYFSQGNFLEKIIKMEDLKDEIFIGLMMFQILSAVCYLHKNNIIHGDLKPENIMMASDNNYYSNDLSYKKRKTFNTSIKFDLEEVNKQIMNKNYGKKSSYKDPKAQMEDYLHNAKNFQFKNLANFQIKLIDFGCSKILSKKHYKYEDVIGTVSYMAPEVAMNKYNEKCDIWSCGVIMYVLLTGEFPFEGKDNEETSDNIINYNFNLKKSDLNISDSAYDLLKLLLTYDPNERISANDALDHRFFSENFNRNNIFNEKINCEEVFKNIKDYNKYNSNNNNNSKILRKFLDSFISYNFINPKELENIRKVFKLLDTNNDGMLSKKELISGFVKYNVEINEEEIDEILRKIKHKNNEIFEYEEFVNISSDKKNLFSEKNLKIAFETLDEDKNGFITKTKLKNIFFEKFDLSDDIFNEFFNEFNTEKNDIISFQDFLKVMKF